MRKLVSDRQKSWQTFESFGVSGAWWAQVVGGWGETDEASGMPKRERIAELLFNKEKGIGISCYRYNLGGGSAQSGKGNISEPSRRAESFDISETEYDWSRDENAVRMMKLAVSEGADEVILFVNSPPERWTKNGKAHCEKAGQTNLPKSNYESFVRYCLDCAEHFIKEGIPVKYISPVNEPVWVWTGGQEGCHYRPHQVYSLMKILAREMDKRPALDGVKISGAENGDIRWFNKMYSYAMLHDKTVRRRVDSVDVHSYFLTPDVPVIRHIKFNRVSFLRRFRKFMDTFYPGVAVKTSEWTHMKGGRDYGIDSALEQTKVMMEDISVLNVTSWQNWIALSNVDYCDGLIYENDEPRTFEMTKRYYAFGNFSKFIEKGSVRIEADAGEGLDCVAFYKDGKTVYVIANRTKDDKDLELPSNVSGVFMTSEKYNLDRVYPENGTIIIPAESITTVITEE